LKTDQSATYIHLLNSKKYVRGLYKENEITLSGASESEYRTGLRKNNAILTKLNRGIKSGVCLTNEEKKNPKPMDQKPKT